MERSTNPAKYQGLGGEVDLVSPPPLSPVHKALRLLIVATFLILSTNAMLDAMREASAKKEAALKLERSMTEASSALSAVMAMPPSALRDEQMRRLSSRLSSSLPD